MKWMSYCWLIIACVSLTACASGGSHQVGITDNPTQSAQTVHAYFQQHPDTLSDLQSAGVKVLRIGDYVRFVVPSKLLFDNLGYRIQTPAYDSLNRIIDVVKHAPKEVITIKAYMFDNTTNAVAAKLTALQAKAVGQYLMSHGVNTRLIYTFGMGNHNEVTQAPDRLLENYRVEITLKELRTRLSG